jgi:hypothetical protein
VIAKGNRQEVDRDFHFVMAAASYHLAHLSARAYSLLAIVEADENFSPIERVLTQLMRRNFGAFRASVLDYRASGEGSDARIAAAIQANLDQAEGAANPVDGGSDFLFDGLDAALTDGFQLQWRATIEFDPGARALPTPNQSTTTFTHSDKEAIKIIAKNAIVHRILEAERNSSLFIDQAAFGRLKDEDMVRRSWLQAFFSTLQDGIIETQNIENISDNLGIINFNYDRCIEHFRFQAMQRLYPAKGT